MSSEEVLQALGEMQTKILGEIRTQVSGIKRELEKAVTDACADHCRKVVAKIDNLQSTLDGIASGSGYKGGKGGGEAKASEMVKIAMGEFVGDLKVCFRNSFCHVMSKQAIKTTVLFLLHTGSTKIVTGSGNETVAIEQFDRDFLILIRRCVDIFLSNKGRIVLEKITAWKKLNLVSSAAVSNHKLAEKYADNTLFQKEVLSFTRTVWLTPWRKTIRESTCEVFIIFSFGVHSEYCPSSAFVESKPCWDAKISSAKTGPKLTVSFLRTLMQDKNFLVNQKATLKIFDRLSSDGKGAGEFFTHELNQEVSLLAIACYILSLTFVGALEDNESPFEQLFKAVQSNEDRVHGLGLCLLDVVYSLCVAVEKTQASTVDRKAMLLACKELVGEWKSSAVEKTMANKFYLSVRGFQKTYPVAYHEHEAKQRDADDEEDDRDDSQSKDSADSLQCPDDFVEAE